MYLRKVIKVLLVSFKVILLMNRVIPIAKLKYTSYLLASSIALEVAGYPKPGNVHRLRDFSDTMFEDFLITATIVEHHVFRALLRGCKLTRGFSLKILIGDLIESSVKESKRVSGGGNTCLGSALLLYPLAVACGYVACINKGVLEASSIARSARDLVYKYSTVLDSVHFYNAVRAASPSYIRKSDVVGDLPNIWDEDYREKLIAGSYRLWDILEYSSRSDIVCREIVDGYTRSLRNTLFLKERLKTHSNWNLALVETYLYQLAHDIDTLITKKHGLNIAMWVSERAKEVLDLCLTSREKCLNTTWVFDHELAKRGINPGSSADIIVSTIALYAVQKRNSIIRTP